MALPANPRRRVIHTHLPGLAVAAVVLGMAEGGRRSPIGTSRSATAVVVGIVAGNIVALPSRCDAGLSFVSHHILRAAIVLLGLRIAGADLAALGGRGGLLVAGVVLVTMSVTQYLARSMGLSPSLGLLVATGYAICGVSAIAAVKASTDAEEEEVAYAVALVTIFGTIAIALLPALGRLLGLEPADFGAWVGASVHDVAQVVAAASTGGPGALDAAIPVKLGRVVLLAPLIALVNIRQLGPVSSSAKPGRRLVPPFVLMFIVAVGVRSTGILPAGALDVAEEASAWMISLALAAVGLTVNLSRLRRVGAAPLLLGAIAWATILVFSLWIVRAT